MPAHIVQGFEQVRFSRKLVGVAVATIQVHYNRALGSKLALVLHPVLEEREFAQFFSTTMKPEIQPSRCLVLGRPVFWNHQSVRLNRSVDFRFISANNEPGLSI